MAWSRQKLEQVLRTRLAEREKLKPLEQAALAYARWQGMTNEPELDRAGQQQELDRQLDALDNLETVAWSEVPKLAEAWGEPVLKGLMSYSLARSRDQLREQAQGVARVLGDDGAVPPSPSRSSARKRRRDRDR